MENKTTKGTRSMVELSLMSAIIIVMAMTPLGYLKTPFLSITLLTIPVAVGSIILGPKGGAFLGAVFGATLERPNSKKLLFTLQAFLVLY